MRLSSRLDAIAASSTLAVSGRITALRAAGAEIVSFAAGEPDFDTPPHVIEAMAAAARGGATRYPPVLGLPALREIVAQRLETRYQVPIGPSEIAVTPGAKYALWATFQALLEPGDEVLVPTPCWVSYEPQIALAGGRMVPVPMTFESGWNLSTEALVRAIGPRTVGIVLNVPTNPTGQLVSPETLATLSQLALSHGLWLLCDDIYAELIFEPSGPFPSPLSGRPELLSRTIIVDGLAKSHAMTGWRIGYMRAPTALIAGISKLLGQTATGVTTFVQHGAIAALEGPQDFVDSARQAYAARGRRLVEGLDTLGIPSIPPRGAFYVLADMRAHFIGDVGPPDDTALAVRLLDSFHLAAVPGSAFGAPGFLRFSFACGEATIDEGLKRLAHFLAKA